MQTRNQVPPSQHLLVGVLVLQEESEAMKVIIEFKTDNAAFVDDWPGEIRRVLSLSSARLADDLHGFRLFLQNQLTHEWFMREGAGRCPC